MYWVPSFNGYRGWMSLSVVFPEENVSAILSQKHEEVADYIMHELKRGVTLYEAKGGYDKQVRCEVVTILAKNEYAC